MAVRRNEERPEYTHSEMCTQRDVIVRLDERLKKVEATLGAKFDRVYEATILLQEKFRRIEARCGWITGLLTALLLAVLGALAKLFLNP